MSTSRITVDGYTITGNAHGILTAHTAIAQAIKKLSAEQIDEFVWFPLTGSEMGLDAGVARNVQLVRIRADSSVSVFITEDASAADWFDSYYATIADGHVNFVRTFGGEAPPED